MRSPVAGLFAGGIAVHFADRRSDEVESHGKQYNVSADEKGVPIVGGADVNALAWPLRMLRARRRDDGRRVGGEPLRLVPHDAGPLENSYTLIPDENRAVVLVGRQWLGPAT